MHYIYYALQFAMDIVVLWVYGRGKSIDLFSLFFRSIERSINACLTIRMFHHHDEQLKVDFFIDFFPCSTN